MTTVRELASESIGRITRRGLEPQIAQIEAALDREEEPVAMAPGRAGAAGVVIVVTQARLLVSVGAPFAKPELAVYSRESITAATASAGQDAWTLTVDHPEGAIELHGLFDRDAKRFADLLRPAEPFPQH